MCVGGSLIDFLIELSPETEPKFRGEIWIPNSFNYTNKIFFGKMVTIPKLDENSDWETMRCEIDKVYDKLKECWSKEGIPIPEPKLYIFPDD